MEINSSYLRESVNSSWYHPNKKNYYRRAGLIEVEEEPKLISRRSKEEVQGLDFLLDKMKRKYRIMNERRFARQTIVQLKRLDSL
jgi:hypothetical protein